MGLKVQDADRILKRFFGEAVPHETPAYSKEWTYIDGHFMMRGASGEGRAPIKAIHEWANKNNVLMVIESEGLNPTGLQEVERCITFLKGLDEE